MQTFLKPPDWWQRTISRFPHSCSRPALITLLLLLVGTVSAGLGISFTKATTPTATISVNAGVSTGTTLRTQLSTNNVWAGMLDEAPSAQAEFKALHMPLVRIHMGDDGTTPAALPEVQYGNWDFSSLDALVNNVTKAGQQALMNVKFAPDWMWTCYPNSVGMTYNNPSQGTGTVKDLTFQTFAQYMARLVSYYNKGSMTTESGQVITNPAGTANRQTYWELWNEPDLNIETPCAPPDGYGITPAQYVTMWNALTSAMLAVDPTLKFVGPGTAGSQFGSSTATGNEYIDDLMSGATVKPVAISFHDYGYWDNSVTDQTIFDGDNSDPATQCCGGIVDITHGVKAIHAQYPTMPIWLTEVNVNAAWGNDPYQRPWTAFGAAWWGALFQQVVPLGVALINQFDVIDSPQFGLIAEQTGAVRLPYWEMMLLEQGFPQGSTFFSSSSSLAGVLSLAVRKPDGTISILVVNRQLNSSTATGGPGLPATVAVNIQGVTPAALTLQQIDATTNVATGPAVQTLSASSTPTLTFGGYGFAVLTVTPSGQGSATPTPTPTTTTAATPTAISSPTPTPTPIPSPTATPTSPSTSSLSSGTCAYLFCDGFESGSLPGTFSSPTVSSGNSLTLDSSLVHSGHESLKAVTVMGRGGNAYITKALTTGQSTLDTRAYLYLSNPVNWAGVQLLTYYAQGNAVAQVTYNVDPTSPNLQVYMDANNHWYSCSRTPSLNVWHSLELQVSLATTATGSFSLQLDGSTICAASGIRTSAMSAESINQVNLGSDTSDSSGGLTIHVDDVAIGTSHIGQ